MLSILNSQGVVFATAMAVSGTVILLALRLQKPTTTHHYLISPHHPPTPILRSCISSGNKNNKTKKKVRFADDVVDPKGHGAEFRRHCHAKMNASSSSSSSSSKRSCGGDVSPPPSSSAIDRGIPANRVALYSGIIRDRGVQRLTYSH